ncbi:MAG: LPS export ABC transporter permease LptF [Methylococcales bacterium]
MTDHNPDTQPGRPVVFFNVLTRLISFEIAKAFLAVLTILILILMSREFGRFLGQAFDGQISNDAIFLLCGLRLISITVALLPSSVFAAVLIVLGRMYRDNEISALGSGGVGVSILYKNTLLIVIPLALAGSALSLEVSPWAIKQSSKVLFNEKENANVRLLVEGRFNEYSRGDIVFYAENISSDRQMKNIFVQERKGNKANIILSKKGMVRTINGVRFIVLLDGQRYLGRSGFADYEISEFKEYALAIDETSNRELELTRDSMSTKELLKSSDPQEIAELHQRLSIPFSMIVLALLAIPLSLAAPKSGVYGNILLAFLVYLLYKNFLSIAQGWLIKGTVLPQFGYWWVYATMLAVGLILSIRNFGFHWFAMVLSGKSRALASYGHSRHSAH